MYKLEHILVSRRSQSISSYIHVGDLVPRRRVEGYATAIVAQLAGSVRVEQPNHARVPSLHPKSAYANSQSLTLAYLPLQPHRQMTARRVQQMLALSWVVSSVASLSWASSDSYCSEFAAIESRLSSCTRSTRLWPRAWTAITHCEWSRLQT